MPKESKPLTPPASPLLLTPPAASTPEAAADPQPLRIAGTPETGDLPESADGLRMALITARAKYRQLEEIVGCQRRVNQKLREMGLLQSGEISRLRNARPGNGTGERDAAPGANAVKADCTPHGQLALAQSRLVLRLRSQLESHGLEPVV